MAGDWIKVQAATPDKPEVMQIARALGVTQEAAFGHLFRIWSWADQQSLNGHALNVTENDLDVVARHAGVATAMRQVGWIAGENGRISIPNFDRHNGESSKKRALASDRKRTQRSRKQRDKSVTREEKRREELKPRKSADLPLGARAWLPEWVPLEAWNGWLEVRTKKHVANTDRAMRLALKELTMLKTAGEDVLAVIDRATLKGWTSFYAPRKDPAAGRSDNSTQPCAHCSKPIAGGHTRMSIGKVCNHCYHDYKEGKWT